MCILSVHELVKNKLYIKKATMFVKTFSALGENNV